MTAEVGFEQNLGITSYSLIVNRGLDKRIKSSVLGKVNSTHKRGIHHLFSYQTNV